MAVTGTTRKVILPGEERRRPSASGLTIYVPRGYESSEAAPALIGHCLVPGCGAKFYRGEVLEWQRHVGWCAKKHDDEIRQASLEARMPVFDPENWDPEVERHMRRVGQRMLAEGRWTVKPSERAGF